MIRSGYGSATPGGAQANGESFSLNSDGAREGREGRGGAAGPSVAVPGATVAAPSMSISTRAGLVRVGQLSSYTTRAVAEFADRNPRSPLPPLRPRGKPVSFKTPQQVANEFAGSSVEPAPLNSRRIAPEDGDGSRSGLAAHITAPPTGGIPGDGLIPRLTLQIPDCPPSHPAESGGNAGLHGRESFVANSGGAAGACALNEFSDADYEQYSGGVQRSQSVFMTPRGDQDGKLQSLVEGSGGSAGSGGAAGARKMVELPNGIGAGEHIARYSKDHPPPGYAQTGELVGSVHGSGQSPGQSVFGGGQSPGSGSPWKRDSREMGSPLLGAQQDMTIKRKSSVRGDELLDQVTSLARQLRGHVPAFEETHEHNPNLLDYSVALVMHNPDHPKAPANFPVSREAVGRIYKDIFPRTVIRLGFCFGCGWGVKQRGCRWGMNMVGAPIEFLTCTGVWSDPEVVGRGESLGLPSRWGGARAKTGVTGSCA